MDNFQELALVWACGFLFCLIVFLKVKHLLKKWDKEDWEAERRKRCLPDNEFSYDAEQMMDMNYDYSRRDNEKAQSG